MADIVTVAWKELRELLGQRGLRGKQGTFLFVAVFGIVLPLENGPAWITSPTNAIAWSWLPMFLVMTVIADAFAGERERHTLETLLASRLSDGAILFGKIGAAIGYAAALTAASLILGLVAVNVVYAHDALLLYSPSVVLTMLGVGLLGALFVAAVGVLISLRAATVRQAQQTLGGVIMALLLVPMIAMRWLPAAWKQSLTSNMVSSVPLAIVALVACATIDAAVVKLAMLRFNRGRLIAFLASIAILVLCPSPGAAQANSDTSAAHRDSLLACASRMAGRARFKPAPAARPGLIGMMRSRESPAFAYLDGLRISIASADSAHATPLNVRVSTFTVSRTTGFHDEEVTPPHALTALADSIRLGCRGRG